MMQWSNLNKCGLCFNVLISLPLVHTLLPSALQRLDSRGIEALILILEEVLNYNLIIGPIVLPSRVLLFYFRFHVGNGKSQMMPN